MIDLSATHATLLSRLRHSPDDQTAWSEFVDRYGPRLLAWGRGWGLQEADAQDAAQMVLIRLAEKIHSFRYDPAQSFRAWLRVLARHAWYDLVATRKETKHGGCLGFAPLESLEARVDLEQRLADAFDLELLQQASAAVRLRVAPRTWEAFQLAALEDRPGPEVAARVGLPLISVYKAKSNVQKMLRAEIARLEGAGAE